MDVRTWLLQSPLPLGIRHRKSILLVGSAGKLGSWEARLSIIRFAIWGWNSKRDDPAPPLEIILELDEYEPLPTCNKDNEEILKYKVLPLTRAPKFLKTITSFVGLVHQRFSYPDLTLYYTLTRKRYPEKKMVTADAVEARKSELNVEEKEHGRGVGERVLYITVFDHKEHATRIYTRDNEADIFYSTNSDAPLVDVGRLQLGVGLGGKFDPKFDPVFSDRDILDSLRKHHQSILEHIQYRVGAADVSQA
ncbi:hypothetical protein BYT27DRAFT_6375931 [Phlegmacium glaucopus]|nr:hypothetical protein BYT27DRAFT_6375931 [Phlegmacium glaucopus]